MENKNIIGQSTEVFEESTDSENSEPELDVVQTFMDESEESDSDTENESAKTKQSSHKSIIHTFKPIIGSRKLTDYIFANVSTYNFKSWKECFPTNKIKLRSLIFNPKWNHFFDIIENKPYFKRMEEILSDILVKNKQTMVPHAELVFNSFNILSPFQIKAVFIGQDPYTDIKKINKMDIPQAMGFSFSVPFGYPKPPSLSNIYSNMIDFNHLKSMPTTGCLSYWIIQGCFMINAALTTFFGVKNAHSTIWKSFTEDLLNYLNNEFEDLIFVVWGKPAHLLCQSIDPKKHRIITSSHPSPMSFTNTFTGTSYGTFKNPRDKKIITYPSFKSVDHFGKINDFLPKGKKILWDLLDC